MIFALKYRTACERERTLANCFRVQKVTVNQTSPTKQRYGYAKLIHVKRLDTNMLIVRSLLLRRSKGLLVRKNRSMLDLLLAPLYVTGFVIVRVLNVKYHAIYVRVREVPMKLNSSGLRIHG